jgi:DNA polymerase-3 subunit alpha
VGNGGYFQYESAGMQKYMKELKPTVFRFNCYECVIPLRTIAYIPSFVKGKMGRGVMT